MTALVKRSIKNIRDSGSEESINTVYANKTEVTHQVSCYAGKEGHGQRQLIWGQGQLNSRLFREQVLAPVGQPLVSSSFFLSLDCPICKVEWLGLIVPLRSAPLKKVFLRLNFLM